MVPHEEPPHDEVDILLMKGLCPVPQGADQADSFPRLPSLAETASLQGLPAREEQADGVPAAEHSGRSTIIDPAVAVDQHLQSVSGAGTTSNGDMQDAGHSSVPAV